MAKLHPEVFSSLLCGMPCKHCVFTQDSLGSPEGFLPLQYVGVAVNVRSQLLLSLVSQAWVFGEAERE